MGEHPQVPTSGNLNCPIGNRRVVDVAAGHVARASGLPNSIGQGLEVIRSRLQRIWIRSDANDLPTTRGSESFAVHLAQVIAMWLCVSRQWAEHCSGICIDIGQCRGRRGLT